MLKELYVIHFRTTKYSTFFNKILQSIIFILNSHLNINIMPMTTKKKTSSSSRFYITKCKISLNPISLEIRMSGCRGDNFKKVKSIKDELRRK